MATRRGIQTSKKPEGYSTSAFVAILVTAIILAIVLIIILIFFFIDDASKIDPNDCPEQIIGLVATPNVNISEPATNCGNIVNCVYTVSSLGEADETCTNLGTKCQSFSMEQQNNSNNFTMRVSETAGTISAPGVNIYRKVQ